MSRRCRPILWSVFWGVMLFFYGGPTALNRIQTKPNILWIYLEDVNGWFSTYGETLIKTPNIDALAESGIRFDQFYTTAGVCSPSRSSIITGMMQTSIGAHNHRSARKGYRGQTFTKYDRNILPKDVVPLPIKFRNAGYWTFNEGGKDDYNFEWKADEFYDFVRGQGGWGPHSFLAGDCLEGNTEGKPFFGQIQLGGGKLKGVSKVTDRSRVSVPPYYPDIPEVREEISNHYDCLIKTDFQVGQIIESLKEQELYQNTIIFLFSDHGMRLHRHKQFLYQGGIHMPFIIAGPGIEANQVNTNLVSAIDISATSLALAGIGIPKTMEGQNLFSETYEKRTHVVAARDRCDFTIDRIRAVITPKFKYIRNYFIDRPYMQPSYKDNWPVTKKIRQMMADGHLNSSQLVFFGNHRPSEEFYDLENDPHELNNLSDEKQYQLVLERHRKILSDWIEETGDLGQLPESDLGLGCVLQAWKDRCVNPEYNRLREQM